MQQILAEISMKAWLRRTVLFLFVASFSGIASKAISQECNPPEVIEAVRAVKSQSTQTPLNVAQLPNARERILSLQQENHGESTELKTVRFYEVRPAIYEVVDGRLVSTTVQLDSESVWIVGLDGNRNTYKLAGFPNSVSDFNRLMHDLAIHVRTTEDALSVFDVFLRLAHPPDFLDSVVGDLMHLQSRALEDFRLRFPKRSRSAAYENWWRGVRRQKIGISPPAARAKASGFELIYYRYAEGVAKESVLVSAEGAVTIVPLKKVLVGKNPTPILAAPPASLPER